MKKIVLLLLSLVLVFGVVGCTSNTDQDQNQTDVVVETFAAEYEMKGTTSSGSPKNDTFIFEGTTEDGIITELNFDVIRNKGTDTEYSKKGIMGYMMNVSDAKIEEVEGEFNLSNFTSFGYDPAFGDGASAQFMVFAVKDNVTNETTFKELTFTDYSQNEVALDKALVAYSYVAKEGGIELTEDTLVKDLIALHDLHDGTVFVNGSNRISFAGYNGGRSYGEQLDAIVAHILANNMTLDEVYEMFKTVNQSSTDIMDRDVVSGATITFVGDFQRMVYVAINGELFEGVISHNEQEDLTIVEVVTQGYVGEIETHVTFDSEGMITDISVRDSQESEGFGADLTAVGSEYIASLIEAQGPADVVSGVSQTSNALNKAVEFAQTYYAGLN